MNEMIMPILLAIIGSSGIWATVQVVITKRMSGKHEETETEMYMKNMLLGLGHDRIYSLCSEYIARGSITLEEYDNLQYLARPYLGLHGNGTGKKLIEQVEKLPIIKED